MNIVLDPTQFNIQTVHFMEKKKNIIIEGFFTKIIYFDQYVTLNAIYIQFPIHSHEKIINNYIFFNPLNNMTLIKKIAQIEEDIANYFREEFHITKPIVLALYNQLYSGKIKVFTQHHSNHVVSDLKNGGIDEGTRRSSQLIRPSQSRLVLKISGIWENHREVGIAYKFLEMFYV